MAEGTSGGGESSRTAPGDNVALRGVTRSSLWATRAGESIGRDGKAAGPTVKVTARITNLGVLHSNKL